jgi:hypothetical protein
MLYETMSSHQWHDLRRASRFGTVGSMTSRRTMGAAFGAAAVLLVACGSSGDDSAAPITNAPAAVASVSPAPAADQEFPDIVDATASATNGVWTFQVTVSSPYDSADRYADGWRIVGPDGSEYGFRLLTHNHASEQPFTRSLAGIGIPDDVEVVTIEGRDQLNGFGGGTFELTLPNS